MSRQQNKLFFWILSSLASTRFHRIPKLCRHRNAQILAGQKQQCWSSLCRLQENVWLTNTFRHCWTEKLNSTFGMWNSLCLNSFCLTGVCEDWRELHHPVKILPCSSELFFMCFDPPNVHFHIYADDAVIYTHQ